MKLPKSVILCHFQWKGKKVGNFGLCYRWHGTLKYAKINVPVRLLISEVFSKWYARISYGTFIEMWIFRNSNILKDFYGNVKISFVESK